MKLANDLLSELGISVTFFVTASLCEEIEKEIKELKNKNHQVGCHGLTHGDDYAKAFYKKRGENKISKKFFRIW